MELILAVSLLLGLVMSISFFLEFKKLKEYKIKFKEQFVELEIANSRIKYQSNSSFGKFIFCGNFISRKC